MNLESAELQIGDIAKELSRFARYCVSYCGRGKRVPTVVASTIFLIATNRRFPPITFIGELSAFNPLFTCHFLSFLRAF